MSTVQNAVAVTENTTSSIMKQPSSEKIGQYATDTNGTLPSGTAVHVEVKPMLPNGRVGKEGTKDFPNNLLARASNQSHHFAMAPETYDSVSVKVQTASTAPASMAQPPRKGLYKPRGPTNTTTSGKPKPQPKPQPKPKPTKPTNGVK
ncbi:hypothetical protein GLOTRDRAFT_92501 [Gloeophyllum trabeum ATCC 11539]|uniref:Uncharacterized protein n=1 Tax=Gloeophyllum trabeum (strain ATCC 11539 / FP-39264 / Madison 617) TaxID=670483 RepID=S7QDW9_GLOTA|nr:uncharacterized protein GLOTRDRAFT_92501 [Gloeophyllum trabeum ATCC 11539]EPQ57483.1 hypothetical protein GLOTRDRAFT_92501 [Gloeophyllum trabeum ATCC 11539]